MTMIVFLVAIAAAFAAGFQVARMMQEPSRPKEERPQATPVRTQVSKCRAERRHLSGDQTLRAPFLAPESSEEEAPIPDRRPTWPRSHPRPPRPSQSTVITLQTPPVSPPVPNESSRPSYPQGMDVDYQAGPPPGLTKRRICTHQKVDRTSLGPGPNHKIQCKDCDMVLWEGVSDCRHLHFSRNGSNQHGPRIQCMQCGTLLVSNKAGEGRYIETSPSKRSPPSSGSK